jgi:hypothetical protein
MGSQWPICLGNGVSVLLSPALTGMSVLAACYVVAGSKDVKSKVP